MSRRLLGVVLCGGQSSRMGTDKALLKVPGGSTFLEHAAERLGTLCDSVCLSGRLRYETKYRVVTDSIEGRGPIVGVVSALAVAQEESYDGCLITPVDTPLLTDADLQKLKESWLQSPGQVSCAICESSDHQQPLIAIYPTRILDALEPVYASENRSLLRWLEGTAHQAVPIPESSCHNVNTPEDLFK